MFAVVGLFSGWEVCFLMVSRYLPWALLCYIVMKVILVECWPHVILWQHCLCLPWRTLLALTQQSCSIYIWGGLFHILTGYCLCRTLGWYVLLAGQHWVWEVLIGKVAWKHFCRLLGIGHSFLQCHQPLLLGDLNDFHWTLDVKVCYDFCSSVFFSVCLYLQLLFWAVWRLSFQSISNFLHVKFFRVYIYGLDSRSFITWALLLLL